jgi:hypothetical protein
MNFDEIKEYINNRRKIMTKYFIKYESIENLYNKTINTFIDVLENSFYKHNILKYNDEDINTDELYLIALLERHYSYIYFKESYGYYSLYFLKGEILNDNNFTQDEIKMSDYNKSDKLNKVWELASNKQIYLACKMILTLLKETDTTKLNNEIIFDRGYTYIPNRKKYSKTNCLEIFEDVNIILEEFNNTTDEMLNESFNNLLVMFLYILEHIEEYKKEMDFYNSIENILEN